MSQQHVSRKLSDRSFGLITSIAIAILTLGGAPFWWHYMPWVKSAPASVAGVVRFSGGCAPYQVFAQNRWAPYGTAVRTEPNVLSKQISSFDGNHSIAVDGWVHAAVAYPRNTPPWNSDIWFHLADGSGWVSFAGVRGEPVAQDPTGLSADGGPAAPTPANCQGAAQ